MSNKLKIIFLFLIALPIQVVALSFKCNGEGVEIVIKNLNSHLTTNGTGGLFSSSEQAYMEYKGSKINSVSMSKSNSSANENNMQTFLGTSFETWNKKSNLKIKIRFYGDASGIARENIRSSATIYDSTKRGQDPEYFVLDSCKEISDSAEHIEAQKNASKKANENKNIMSLIAKAPASKERQKNKDVCTDVKKERSQSAVRGILGEPNEIQKPAKDTGFDEITWVYKNGIKVKFDFMEHAKEVSFPDSMKTDCLYYRFEEDLSSFADKCVSSIKRSDLSYEKIKDCYSTACKRKSDDWPDANCTTVLDIIRPNAKNLSTGGK